MKKQLYLVPVCLFLLTTLLSAQPDCGGTPNTIPPAENCPLSCIYCDFYVYNGTTGGYQGDGIPPGGFCSMIQNDQWMGFVAGATQATFTVTPSNCENGNGIQVALYPGCNESPVACNAGCSGCGNQIASITADLVIGHHYFLLIDGFSGDVCDINVNFTPASAVKAPDVDSVGPVSGPDTICPGGRGIYSVKSVAGAGVYGWASDVPGVKFEGISIWGSDPPVGQTVRAIFPLSFKGTANICATAFNACKPAVNTSCLKVQVQPLKVKDLPDITIGPSKLPYMLPWGNLAYKEGVYQTTLVASTGCDSTVRVRLVTCSKTVQLPTQLLCSDTCITVCGVKYCQSGTYSVLCNKSATCDSSIQFKVTYAGTPKVLPSTRVALTCTDTIRTLSASAADAGINWVDKQGTLLSADQNLTVTSPGVYIARSVLAGGKVCGTKAITVKQNIQQPDLTAQGGMLSPTDHSLMLQAKSSTSGVRYYWTGPDGFSSQQQNPIVMVAGVYTVTVVDLSNGCQRSLSVEVTGG